MGGKGKGFGKGKGKQQQGERREPNQKQIVERSPQGERENQQVLDKFLPFLAQLIDGQSGVMKVQDLCLNAEVKAYLETVPVGFTKKLSEIFMQFPEYFIRLKFGLVGTAVGYDTGLILNGGKLNPEQAHMFGLTPEQVIAGGEPQEQKEPREQREPRQQQPQRGEQRQQQQRGEPRQPIRAPQGGAASIDAAADALWNAALNLNNEQGFMKAILDMQMARAKAKGSPSSNNWFPAGNQGNNQGKGMKRGEREPFILKPDQRDAQRVQVFQKIVDILRKDDNQTHDMGKLASHPQIAPLKKGAISKFMDWLKSFPEQFMVNQSEGDKSFSVTLIGDGIMNPSAMPTAKRQKRAL